MRTMVPRALDRVARQLLVAAGDDWSAPHADLVALMEGDKAFADHASHFEAIAERAGEIREAGEWPPEVDTVDTSRPIERKSRPSPISRTRKPKPKGDAEPMGSKGTKKERRTEWLRGVLEENPDITAADAYARLPDEMGGLTELSFANGFFYSAKREIQKERSGDAPGAVQDRTIPESRNSATPDPEPEPVADAAPLDAVEESGTTVSTEAAENHHPPAPPESPQEYPDDATPVQLDRFCTLVDGILELAREADELSMQRTANHLVQSLGRIGSDLVDLGGVTGSR